MNGFAITTSASMPVCNKSLHGCHIARHGFEQQSVIPIPCKAKAGKGNKQNQQEACVIL